MAGVDEAGRGPLAGPVIAGAVAMSAPTARRLMAGELRGLTDSKQLTAARREHYFTLLYTCHDVRIGLGEADVATIDKLNILAATHLAMRRALLALGRPLPDHALIDGLPAANLPTPATAVVKGDRLSLLIAAASVVAKVTRDRLMVQLAQQYPQYGWEQNKGYGTCAHLAALRQYGVTSQHRRSFQPVAELLQPTLWEAGEA